MSGRSKKDYQDVLLAIIRRCPSMPRVSRMLMDFELAMWQAARAVMLTVALRGCSFHWSPAVYRKIQEVGLQSQYREDETIHKICLRILALQFLPAAHIPPVFYSIQNKIVHPLIREMSEYVQRTWIQSTTWPPETWSAFGETVRTNNDLESWLARLNRKAQNKGLNLYLLINLLNREADIASLNVQLLTEDKICRVRRRNQQETDAKLEQVFVKYVQNHLDANELLKLCSRIYNPF